MTRSASVCLLAWSLLSVSCGRADPGPDCHEDCTTCTDGRCPGTHCGLRVVLAETCAGRSGPLEVALGQCVQDRALLPGEMLQPCVALGLHESLVVHGRSEEWAFQETASCTAQQAGGIIVLTFDCDAGGTSDADGDEG
ncbi:MAG: hypothetical protein FJ098_03440 [Deltaproteobacteria bacterium]|nr:hypothetical protein [Deltaproteobacteria bacterium]